MKKLFNFLYEHPELWVGTLLIIVIAFSVVCFRNITTHRDDEPEKPED